MWRDFEPDADPRGKPYTFDLRPPLLAPAEGSPQLPHLPKQADLGKAVVWLKAYRRLRPDDALSVARVARAFQLGIWSADDDPDLSWLRLITALETAAKNWTGKSEETDIEQLRRTWPEVGELLLKAEPGLAAELAALIAPQSRIKAAVLEFISTFAPKPPQERPKNGFERLDWDLMQDHLAAIYDRRSEMLHQAIPLPRPMTSVTRFNQSPPWTETTFRTSFHDSNWPQNKAPMPLWTFSYIVAGALKNWWWSLSGRGGSNPKKDTA